MVDFSTIDFESYASVNNILGVGAAGAVHGPFTLGHNIYALKKCQFGDDRRSAMTKEIQDKKDIWESMEHINLIKIQFVKLSTNALYILMEYASGGSLGSTLLKLRESACSLPMTVMSDWSKQIAQGMLYLHSRKLVHRDLKPVNVVLMEPFDSNDAHKEVVLKITDFDDISQHDTTKTMSLTGTLAYMAPEVLTAQRFSKFSDVWSYGVLVWEMLTGKIPHEGLKVAPLALKAEKGELQLPVEGSAPEAFRKLINACMSDETSSRPSFDDIVNGSGNIGPALEQRHEIPEAKNRKFENLQHSPDSLEGKRTIEELQNQFTELRQQKAVLEERLIYEATNHRMRLAEAEGKKVEFQEKVKRLYEAEDKKIELQEKVQRLFKRNHELGVSLYLPPKDSFEYKVEPQKTVKTRASKEPQNLGVCGVTLLDKELFVISDQHPEVEVYDMFTFKHSRNILLHGVYDPGDIAACNENRCIYIVDWTERNLEDKLLRLDSDGKEEIKRLCMKDDECRLFVTRELNVLVTFHRSRKIVEYARDWSVVFQTNFKDASIYPIHSVKLSNGLFAICHGTINESTHRVCIVDDQGHLLKSFGGRRGAGVEQVNFPNYLTVDRNDNILVTDRDNRRVLVLNCRLELTVELLAEKDGIRRPRSLLLDETNGRLFVADCDEKFDKGQLLIFNVK